MSLELHARYVVCPDCGGAQCERCKQFEGYVRDGGWVEQATPEDDC